MGKPMFGGGCESDVVIPWCHCGCGFLVCCTAQWHKSLRAIKVSQIWFFFLKSHLPNFGIPGSLTILIPTDNFLLEYVQKGYTYEDSHRQTQAAKKCSCVFTNSYHLEISDCGNGLFSWPRCLAFISTKDLKLRAGQQDSWSFSHWKHLCLHEIQHDGQGAQDQ